MTELLIQNEAQSNTRSYTESYRFLTKTYIISYILWNLFSLHYVVVFVDNTFQILLELFQVTGFTPVQFSKVSRNIIRYLKSKFKLWCNFIVTKFKFKDNICFAEKHCLNLLDKNCEKISRNFGCCHIVEWQQLLKQEIEMGGLVAVIFFWLFFANFPLIKWLRICKLINEINYWGSFSYFKLFTLLVGKVFALHLFS